MTVAEAGTVAEADVAADRVQPEEHEPQPPAQRRRGWERPALIALLAATAALYLWGLGASGWANAYYSAAAQAGSQSWSAMFFGSFDASNFITVDKTPASLWVMALSARIFGVNSWSILVPQALEGVVAVAVLYATVRRWFFPAAGLIAGAVMALTPVAVLMFRFNNPDALLVLLLTLGAYAVTRALEQGATKWLLLAGAFVGFAFLAKMLQALLVVPAFGLVYLIAAPVGLWKRVWQLLAALGSMIVAAGWWVAIVSLIPASSRPYIGGSQTNSVLELTLGYNGFGRLTGDEVGSVGGGGGGNSGNWGLTGLTRLFTGEVGGQASWLLPAALIVLVAGLVLTARAPRTSRTRAAFVLWGGWLLATGAVFSLMAGIFHAYYTVALAPAIGALVGIGAAALWEHRASIIARSVLAGALAVTAVWAHTLLGRSADFVPWLRTAVLVAGLLAALALLALPWLRLRRFAVVVAAAGLAAGLAGPAAYALDTAATPHTGSIPTAGPSVQGSGFGGGRMGGGRVTGGTPNGATQNGMAPGGARGGAAAGGAAPGGTAPGGAAGGAAQGGGTRTDGGTGRSGLLTASTPNSELVALLQSGAEGYTWVGAAVGSQNAAGYQLASGEPVMSIGGFNGTDPSISLEAFQQLVAQKKVHYFFAGGSFGRANGGSDSAQQIASWVTENFTAQTVGGTTVYDLTQPL